MLPTARSSAGGPDFHIHDRPGSGGESLVTHLNNLPTPRASDGEKGSPNQCFFGGNPGLPAALHRLPTPKARDYMGGPGDVGSKGDPALPAALHRLPTPSAAQAVQGQNDPDGKRGQTMVGALRGQEWGGDLLPTPRASAGENRQTKPTPSQLAGKHGMSLPAALNTLLPTPTVLGNNNRAGISGKAGDGLATVLRGTIPHQLELLPSPSARDYRSGKGRKDNGHTPQVPERLGGRINPDWEEMFMGYPAGWTDPEKTDLQPFPGFHLDPWGLPPLATGMPGQTARIKMIGNAVLPQAVELAFILLSGLAQ